MGEAEELIGSWLIPVYVLAENMSEYEAMDALRRSGLGIGDLVGEVTVSDIGDPESLG